MDSINLFVVEMEINSLAILNKYFIGHNKAVKENGMHGHTKESWRATEREY